MKKVCLFSQLVHEDFWMCGSKSALKVMISKQHKPKGESDSEDWKEDETEEERERRKFEDVIKKYAQAKIPHHRDVMHVWEKIKPALDEVDEALELPKEYPEEQEDEEGKEADHREIRLQMAASNDEEDSKRPLLDALGYRPPLELASTVDLFSDASEYRLRKYRECLDGVTGLYMKQILQKVNEQGYAQD